MSESERRIPWLALLPLVAFVALAGLFLVRLTASGDPARLPSADTPRDLLSRDSTRFFVITLNELAKLHDIILTSP